MEAIVRFTMKSREVKKFFQSIRSLSTNQIPYAASKAINDTIFDVYRAEGKALQTFIDRPRPFTAKAYKVIKADKRRLVAYIKTKQVQEGYLQWAVYGGRRAPNKTANVVPVEHRLNPYGNMPRGSIKKMLEDKQRYFSGVPRGYSEAGIWKRVAPRHCLGQSGRVLREIPFKGGKGLRRGPAADTKVEGQRRR